MQQLCRCVFCERERMGNDTYSPRFYLHHHDFIVNTVTIEEELQSNTVEMKFSIYGNPLPEERNVYHDQYYSDYEIELWKHCLTDLIIGHIFVPFPLNQQLQVEIFFHIKHEDYEVPEDSLYSLADELIQAMVGVCYPELSQVQQYYTYKAFSDTNEGMTMVVIKNEIDQYREVDFDD